MDQLSDITEFGVLRGLYGEPMHTALIKEVPYLTEPYAALIRASPFVILATSGEEGLDASPRGGTPGFVRVVDKTTLILPDRSGNNRVDSFSNLVSDPRIALIFLIPGISECMRVNGKARISVDPELLRSFVDGNGKLPRAAVVITIDRCYAQCSQAVMRAKLWDAHAQADHTSLPTFGKMLQACQAEFDAGVFDRSYVGVPPDD